MIKQFTGEETVADIVSIFPSASNLLLQYQIDFCCGGNQPLQAALEEQKVNPEAFLKELNDAYAKEQTKHKSHLDWRQASSSVVIKHIIQTHHAYLKQELPVLSALVTKVMDRHGQKHPELVQLHRWFHQLKEELEEHVIKEEQVVFPLIQEYEQTASTSVSEKLEQEIIQLETEHQQTGDLLKQMRQVTQGYRLPERACRTYTLTYHKLKQLEADIYQHIHLENHILFPRFAQLENIRSRNEHV